MASVCVVQPTSVSDIQRAVRIACCTGTKLHLEGSLSFDAHVLGRSDLSDSSKYVILSEADYIQKYDTTAGSLGANGDGQLAGISFADSSNGRHADAASVRHTSSASSRVGSALAGSADPPCLVLSLGGMDRVLALDTERRLVKVQAGISLEALRS